MKNEYYTNSNDYINRWVISYADFVTMLLALFMVLFAANSMGDLKVKDVNNSIQKIFANNTTEVVKTEQKEISKVEENDSKKFENEAEGMLENSGKTILDGGDGILDGQKVIDIIKSNLDVDTTVKVIKNDKGIVIRLEDTMLFDQGSAIIKPQAVAMLDKISVSLTKFENPILIEGHTDSMPIRNEKFPSNWELSTARATNIIKYLTEVRKFPPGRLSAVGYGEYMPIAENTSPQGRAKNRRVDIIVLSSDKK